MMHGWWDGSAAPWYGMIFGPLMMIAFIVVTVVIIAWVLHALGLRWRSDFQGVNTALDTLSTAARGEIDRAEYEERKKLLVGS